MRNKVKLLLVILMIPAFVLAFWPHNSVNAADKTCVCHVEDKDTLDGHVIEIATSSLPAHQAHGDVVVSCDLIGQECSAD